MQCDHALRTDSWVELWNWHFVFWTANYTWDGTCYHLSFSNECENESGTAKVGDYQDLYDSLLLSTKKSINGSTSGPITVFDSQIPVIQNLRAWGKLESSRHWNLTLLRRWINRWRQNNVSGISYSTQEASYKSTSISSKEQSILKINNDSFP